VARRRSRKTGDWLPVEGFDDLPPVLRDEGAFLAKPLKQTAGLHRDTYPLLAETHADLARLDEAVHRSPGGPALILVTRLLDIQGGAELSGEFVGLREIFMLDVPNPAGPAVDEQFRRRLDFCRAAVALAQSGRAVDMTLFNDVTVASATAGAEDGIRWRNGLWWLGGLEPADATLIGAPPDRRMVTQTLKCLAWMDSPPAMPLIAQLGVVNAQLATLAPLADLGNLAELYVILQLIRHQVLRDHVLPLSHWLTGQRDSYRAHLRDYADGDIDSWVVFFAKGIQQACRDQMRLIAKLEKIRQRQLSRFTREDKFLDVVGGLIGHPVTNKHLIAELLNISLDYAGELVDRLVSEQLAEVVDRPSKLLQVEGKRYATVVYNPEILALLSRHLPLPPDGDRDFPE
jgi:hypothetical protein